MAERLHRTASPRLIGSAFASQAGTRSAAGRSFSPRSSPARPARFVGILCLMLSLLAFTPHARAQGDRLTTEITRSPTELNAAQVDAVRTFVTKQLEALGSDDHARIGGARSRLIEPLNIDSVGNTAPSPAFRLAYSRELAAALKSLAEDSREHVAINALRVAAEVGTDATTAILEAHLAHTDDRVRLTVRVMEAIRLAPPAMQPDRAQSLVNKVAQALKAETDSSIARSFVRSLAAATQIDRARFEPVRADALRLMCDALSDRISELAGSLPDEQTSVTLFFAGVSARDVLAQATMPAATCKSAARFAGAVLANIIKVNKGRGLPNVPSDEAPERQTALQLAQLAQQIIPLAQKCAGTAQTSLDVAKHLASGTVNDDAKFNNAVEDEIITKILTKDPFSLAADQFR
jgi:hypothetical protein